MILRDAESVGSALQLAARVHAFAYAFADLEADLLWLALQVIRATAVQMASLVQIIGIAGVAGRAHARPILADGTRTALDVAALVHALAIDAGVVEGTGHGLAARAGGWIGARHHLHLLALDERIAEETVLAVAVVAAHGVDADRIATACVPVALIDI